MFEISAPRLPMPLMSHPAEPGEIDATVAVIAATDPELGEIARAEAYYFRGQAENAHNAAATFLDHVDPALSISANFICAYANLTLNRAYISKECISRIAALRESNAVAASPALLAAHKLIDAAACVLLHLSAPFPPEDFIGHMGVLPEGLRLFACYSLAHLAYLRGEYGRCVGMAEIALATKQARYPIPEQFLHLVATMGHMSLKNVDDARRHFMAAWSIAEADGLIEEIGEHHGLLQGMLETCLKDGHPAEYARVVDITYRFSYGWRRLHNPEAGAQVADNLTTTEFSIAMLASRGWSNAEIANHLGISAGTVKNRLSAAYAKLGIASRAELAQYMLQ